MLQFYGSFRPDAARRKQPYPANSLNYDRTMLVSSSCRALIRGRAAIYGREEFAFYIRALAPASPKGRFDQATRSAARRSPAHKGRSSTVERPEFAGYNWTF